MGSSASQHVCTARPARRAERMPSAALMETGAGSGLMGLFSEAGDDSGMSRIGSERVRKGHREAQKCDQRAITRRLRVGSGGCSRSRRQQHESRRGHLWDSQHRTTSRGSRTANASRAAASTRPGQSFSSLLCYAIKKRWRSHHVSSPDASMTTVTHSAGRLPDSCLPPSCPISSGRKALDRR